MQVFQAQQRMEQFEKNAQARLAVADMQKRDHLADNAASANYPQQAANGDSQVPSHALQQISRRTTKVALQEGET